MQNLKHWENVFVCVHPSHTFGNDGPKWPGRDSASK